MVGPDNTCGVRKDGWERTSCVESRALPFRHANGPHTHTHIQLSSSSNWTLWTSDLGFVGSTSNRCQAHSAQLPSNWWFGSVWWCSAGKPHLPSTQARDPFKSKSKPTKGDLRPEATAYGAIEDIKDPVLRVSRSWLLVRFSFEWVPEPGFLVSLGSNPTKASLKHTHIVHEKSRHLLSHWFPFEATANRLILKHTHTHTHRWVASHLTQEQVQSIRGNLSSRKPRYSISPGGEAGLQAHDFTNATPDAKGERATSAGHGSKSKSVSPSEHPHQNRF